MSRTQPAAPGIPGTRSPRAAGLLPGTPDILALTTVETKGYLLDTSVASLTWDAVHSYRRNQVLERQRALGPNAQLYVSTVSLGEFEDGLHTSKSTATPETRAQGRAAMVANRTVLEVTQEVARYYGQLRAALLEAYAPRPDRARFKGMRPEDMTDPVTAKSLMIQENDLWLYSTAAAYNLVFVTQDAKMRRISDVVRARRLFEEYAFAAPEVWAIPKHPPQPPEAAAGADGRPGAGLAAADPAPAGPPPAARSPAAETRGSDARMGAP